MVKKIGNAKRHIAEKEATRIAIEESIAVTKKEVKSLKKAFSDQLKKAKARAEEAQSRCDKVKNWNLKFMCWGFDKKCRRNKKARPKAKKLCTGNGYNDLASIHKRLQRYSTESTLDDLGDDGDDFPSIDDSDGLGDSIFGRRRRRGNLTSKKAQKKFQGTKFRIFPEEFEILTDTLNKLEAGQKSARIKEATLQEEDTNLQTAKERLKQAKERLNKEEMIQNSCTLELGTMPVIAEFRDPAKHTTKHTGTELGFCVLDKNGLRPKSNVNLYCASSTQPTTKDDEVRACKPKGGGVILVKHQKQDMVTTRDASGGKVVVCIDYIKVSACGGGNTVARTCAARKLLYNCQVGTDGRCSALGRECDTIERGIAIANV